MVCAAEDFSFAALRGENRGGGLRIRTMCRNQDLSLQDRFLGQCSS